MAASRRIEARRWQPQYVLVGREVADHETARAISGRCPDAKQIIVSSEPGEADRDILLRALDLPASRAAAHDLTSLSRRSLFLWDSPQLTQHMATGPAWERRCFNFVKILPYIGTCTFNCSYCWFKDPVLIPRVNVGFFDRLPTLLADHAAQGRPPTTFTFTHYKTDCFGLEHLTGFCRRAADLFEEYDEFNVQFLTKSSWTDGLLVDPVPRSALVGFSVNANDVAEAVDLGTASIDSRLDAAARLANAGVAVVLRVDPMFVFPGWEQSYQQLARNILDRFRPVQITLGTPRFQTMDELNTVVETTKAPRARQFMIDQIPLMDVTKPGQSQGSDSDMAYFKNMAVSYSDDVRRSLYANAIQAFRDIDVDVPLGLCEEGAEMWDAVGLSWSGDRTKDCSCNFIGPASSTRLSPAHRRQLQVLQNDAIGNDTACRTGGAQNATAAALMPKS